MRPKISWSDLRGAAVGVWGTGIEGRASIRKLRSLGLSAPVVVDDVPTGPVDGLEVLATGTGGLDALGACQVVLKSPGISRYRDEVGWLGGQNVAVVGGLGLWLEEIDRDRVVGITGTKGKSTTASIAGHILRQLGYRCFVGGNLGQPPFDPGVPTDIEFWVIEISSYQATDVASSPATTAVTSLHPDHLDWHGTVEAYYRDKLSLCSQPGAARTVANGEDERLRAHRDLLGPIVEWVTADGPPATWVRGLGLLGRHNQVNALMAQACVRSLGVAADDDALDRAEGRFSPLPSRLYPIGTVAGVSFVDDSLSTNVLPTLAAMSVFDGQRVALIVGGYDRHIDYAPLAGYLARRPTPTLVLGLPQTGPDIVAAVIAHAPSPDVHAKGCDNLGDAVQEGFEWARPDGVVLLSPAAASFGQFHDYKDRAAAFFEAMARCASNSQGSEGKP